MPPDIFFVILSNQQPPQSETFSISVDLDNPTKVIPCSFYSHLIEKLINLQ